MSSDSKEVSREDLICICVVGGGKCPHCEGEYETGVYEYRPTGEVRVSVIHTKPACVKYLTLEPLDYVTEANKSTNRSMN